MLRLCVALLPSRWLLEPQQPQLGHPLLNLLRGLRGMPEDSTVAFLGPLQQTLLQDAGRQHERRAAAADGDTAGAKRTLYVAAARAIAMLPAEGPSRRLAYA